MGTGRSTVVNFRLTEDERARINADAEAAGISVSAYVRKRVLGHSVISHADMVMVNELRRQGGLLKLALSMGAIDKVETNEALRLIADTIKGFGNDR